MMESSVVANARRERSNNHSPNHLLESSVVANNRRERERREMMDSKKNTPVNNMGNNMLELSSVADARREHLTAPRRRRNSFAPVQPSDHELRVQLATLRKHHQQREETLIASHQHREETLIASHHHREFKLIASHHHREETSLTSHQQREETLSSMLREMTEVRLRASTPARLVKLSQPASLRLSLPLVQVVRTEIQRADCAHAELESAHAELESAHAELERLRRPLSARRALNPVPAHTPNPTQTDLSLTQTR